MRIGIIGAGIGGLVAALGLQRAGHELAVFEKNAQAGAIGAGLSLFANSFAALDAVGLSALVRPLTSSTAPAFRAGQRVPSGRWLTTIPSNATASMRVLHRAELHDALCAALQPGTLRTGAHASAEPDGSPAITVAGRKEEYDLVIAADGIRSSTRASLGLDPGVRYAGYTAWRGITSTTFDLDGQAGETWGRGRRFGIAPLPDGRVYWFATQTLPRDTAIADEREHVLEAFARWHNPIRSLIEGTDSAAVLRHDIYDLAAPLSSHSRGRTLLLGDAAHAMTPDLGQGAGQAIEDAATLALLLRNCSSDEHADRAIASYDSARVRRTRIFASRSRAMGRAGQLSSPLAAGLRDLAFTMMPSRALGRAAQRMQQWVPPAELT